MWDTTVMVRVIQARRLLKTAMRREKHYRRLYLKGSGGHAELAALKRNERWVAILTEAYKAAKRAQNALQNA